MSESHENDTEAKNQSKERKADQEEHKSKERKVDQEEQKKFRFSREDYRHPAAAWGAAMSVGRVLLEQGEIVDGVRAIFKINHENGGFDCPGCAWPDDRKGLSMDICENGIKHVTWEMTKKRTDRDFFASHTVTELSGGTDFALEDQGRLTEPMVYEAESDKQVPICGADALGWAG